MRKILISALAVLLLILSPSLVLSEESISRPNPVPTIDYQLPYPGILPDNPLYSLKTIRDKITGVLIGNPLKKAEFNLLKADTLLSAALTLMEQKKSYSRVFKTIEKAENYFEEAVTKTREAKAQGIDTREFMKKLSLSSTKHQEIIKKTEKKLSKEDIKKFELLKRRVEKLNMELKK